VVVGATAWRAPSLRRLRRIEEERVSEAGLAPVA